MSNNYKYAVTESKNLNPIGMYIGFGLGLLQLISTVFIMYFYVSKFKYQKCEKKYYRFTIILILLSIVLLSITIYQYNKFVKMSDTEKEEKQKQFETFNKFGISFIVLYIIMFIDHWSINLLILGYWRFLIELKENNSEKEYKKYTPEIFQKIKKYIC